MSSDFPEVQDLPLNGDWQFAYLPTGNGSVPALPAADRYLARMPVPAYWDDHLERLRPTEIWRAVTFNPVPPQPLSWPASLSPPDAGLPFLIGTGFYRRSFRVPEAWKDRTVTLRIGGVTLEAWVWVNGALACQHLGHSIPFEVPLQEQLHVGAENEIVIAVSNLRADRRGCALRGYAGRAGGIRQGISLHVAGRSRIGSLVLRSRAAQAGIRWRFEVAGAGERTGGLQADWRVLNRIDGRELLHGTAKGSGADWEWETPSTGLQRWSDREPVLYTAEVRLRADGHVLDTLRQEFGLREFTRDGARLLLNGIPAYLRGTTEMHYFPLTCTAPEGTAEYVRSIRAMKAIGFNWLRFHTWVPSQEYLQAADELGMLVQIEPPGGSTAAEWAGIVRACRTHPSVVLYCAGNERTLDEATIETVREFAAIQKRLAPDALFSPMEALAGVEYGDLGPGAVQDPFPHHPGRLARLKEFSDVLEGYLPEASYHSVRGRPETVAPRTDLYARPVLAHELCIHGNYLNLDLEHRYAGTRTGGGLFAATRAHLAEHGLLDKAALYYRNSCAHMRIQRKQAVEMTRQCAGVSGYDLLSATDAHWHRSGYPCGVMNEFFELKPGECAEDVLAYNGESVLLLGCATPRNLRSGQDVAFAVSVSLYGPRPIETGTLSWALQDRHETLASGTLACGTLENGGLRKLSTLRLTVPEVASARKATLQLRLTSEHCALANRWDLWIFPARPSNPKPPALRAISTLSPREIEALSDGADLLLLGSQPFPSGETWFQSSSAGRAGGHKGTVIAGHPLMELFPHEGYCDWQFFEMLDTQARAVLFERPELPFDPIIELISPCKRVRKMAVLFEYRVGVGRLLVCTLNLQPQNPAAAHLRQAMETYAAGPHFRPRTALGADVLLKLQAENARVEGLALTDQGKDPNA